MVLFGEFLRNLGNKISHFVKLSKPTEFFIDLFDICTSSIHLDTSSIHVDGQYLPSVNSS